VILVVIGIALLVVGVLYLTIAADKLPSFMGHIAHTTGHRAKRGVAGLVLGVLFLVGGGVAMARARR
jgi:amino acid permease